jgi:uncharacterized protein YlxP (DUF503 family)
MTVGVLRVRLRLPSRTLKEKRTIVKSLTERIRNRFNASAAEVDELDDVASAVVAVVCVSNEASHADAMLQSVLGFIQAERLDAEVVDVETELISA